MAQPPMTPLQIKVTWIAFIGLAVLEAYAAHRY